MKTLLVMRHAKSDWDADYARDHDRPLNRRGEEAAEEMGRFLARIDLVPELVLSSTAVRARTTAELAIAAGAWDADLHLDPGLYRSAVDTVLGIVAKSPDVARLMVVGHQPTWGSLVARLTGEVVDAQSGARVGGKVDGALVGLDLHAACRQGVMALVLIARPRGLFAAPELRRI